MGGAGGAAGTGGGVAGAPGGGGGVAFGGGPGGGAAGGGGTGGGSAGSGGGSAGSGGAAADAGAPPAKDAAGARDGASPDVRGASPDARLADAAAGGPPGTLDGFRIELPCKPEFYEPQACETTAAVADQKHTLTFGGTPGTVYEVTLRVRGLVEYGRYPGGTASGNFVEGGAPEPGTHQLVLQLSVAAPKRDYFFNNGTHSGDDVFKLDYMAKVKVEGGSTLTFRALDANMDQSKNYKNIVVEGIPPAPMPFNGQFVQFNVVSVNPPL